jgi:hypothetical protein
MFCGTHSSVIKIYLCFMLFRHITFKLLKLGALFNKRMIYTLISQFCFAT